MERIVDIQLQIQNLVKLNLANIANIKLVDIKTTLLQASNSHKEQFGGDIYSITDNLWNIIHGDIEKLFYLVYIWGIIPWILIRYWKFL